MFLFKQRIDVVGYVFSPNLHYTLVSSIGYIFFQISNQLFYSILTLKLDFSRACLLGLHILLGQLLPI